MRKEQTMETTYDSVIEQIVQSIFSTMLNINLVRVEEPAPSDHESLLAAVQIAGQWTGSAVLALSFEVASESAAAMLKLPLKEVTEADRKDVAAEIVNMIGGNLKSVLPGPSFLSLPTIIAGHDLDLQVHHAELIDDVVLRTESGSLRIRLYAKGA
jgi:chemotaxis protein CheX